jgi:hypothetical protein
MNIYLASSWRNARQGKAAHMLRGAGHTVYTYKDGKGDGGFDWSELGAQDWNAAQCQSALANHHLVRERFERDHDAMRQADACVLPTPGTTRAYMEAGWFAGAGKPVIVWLDKQPFPNLMHKLAGAVCVSGEEVLSVLETL